MLLAPQKEVAESRIPPAVTSKRQKPHLHESGMDVAFVSVCGKWNKKKREKKKPFLVCAAVRL